MGDYSEFSLIACLLFLYKVNDKKNISVGSATNVTSCRE